MSMHMNIFRLDVILSKAINNWWRRKFEGNSESEKVDEKVFRSSKVSILSFENFKTIQLIKLINWKDLSTFFWPKPRAIATHKQSPMLTLHNKHLPTGIDKMYTNGSLRSIIHKHERHDLKILKQVQRSRSSFRQPSISIIGTSQIPTIFCRSPQPLEPPEVHIATRPECDLAEIPLLDDKLCLRERFLHRKLAILRSIRRSSSTSWMEFEHAWPMLGNSRFVARAVNSESSTEGSREITSKSSS